MNDIRDLSIAILITLAHSIFVSAILLKKIERMGKEIEKLKKGK